MKEMYSKSEQDNAFCFCFSRRASFGCTSYLAGIDFFFSLEDSVQRCKLMLGDTFNGLVSFVNPFRTHSFC